MKDSRCLVIADDLTGAADTGVQFVIRGLDTRLVSPEGGRPLDFGPYRKLDVLVVNTRSRGLDDRQASERISLLLRDYRPDSFGLVYKKIDSTLRGHIGAEIDALMDKTGLAIGFVAPSFPEQQRTVEGGILMVDGKPLSFTEATGDAATSIHEYRVPELLRAQSRREIAWVGLARTASKAGKLDAGTMREGLSAEGKLIVFDAVTRGDLRDIAEAGFRMPRQPLWIGSAGLAGEIAGMISALPAPVPFTLENAGTVHVMIVCGSASGITHAQIRHLEQKGFVDSFALEAWLGLDQTGRDKNLRTAERMGKAIKQGHVLLKAPSERMDRKGGPIVRTRIADDLAALTRRALDVSGMPAGSVVLVATGGDTAMAVLQALDAGEMHILGQVLDGIAVSRLAGGAYEGLSVVTKAGAFGKDDTLEKIIGIVAGKAPGPFDPHPPCKEDPWRS